MDEKKLDSFFIPLWLMSKCVDELTAEQLVQLMRAVREYVDTGEVRKVPEAIRGHYGAICEEIDRQNRMYREDPEMFQEVYGDV